jgi:Domain of unknown function (DUF4135)
MGTSWVEIVEAAADFRDALSGDFFEFIPESLSPKHGAVNRESWEPLPSRDREGSQSARRMRHRRLTLLQGLATPRLRNPLRLPGWARHVRNLIVFVQDSAHARVPAAPTFRRPCDHLFFLPLCLPPMDYAFALFEARCASRLRAQLAPIVVRKFRSLLISRLLTVIAPTANECFTGLMRGHDVASQASVNEQLLSLEFFSPSPEARFLRILEEFPALARLVVEIIIGWQGMTKQFLVRVDSDWKQLSRAFVRRKNSDDPGGARIVDVKVGLSDPHDRNRSVVAFRPRAGSWIIYKPRSCQGELEWSRLVRGLLNSRLRPFNPKVITRHGYGWMEFVPSRPCRTMREMRCFYRRAGALLCLAQVARAVDLHRENFIAFGNSPVVVDLESLSQPWNGFSPGNGMTKSRYPPLCRTGLLAINFGSFQGQLESSHALDSSTDRDPRQKHRPSLNGFFGLASDFLAEIEDGFRKAAIELGGDWRRRARLNRMLSRIASRQWRQIYRPTRRYVEMREMGRDPTLLRNGTKRFIAILRQCADGDVSPKIALTEARSLARYDIPRLTASVPLRGSKDRLREPPLPELLDALAQIRTALYCAPAKVMDPSAPLP